MNSTSRLSQSKLQIDDVANNVNVHFDSFNVHATFT